jgi:hypothetical protein
MDMEILLILVFSRHFQGNVSVESGCLTGPVILKTFSVMFTVLSCGVARGNQDIRHGSKATSSIRHL